MDSFNQENDEILEEILDESEIESIIDETEEGVITDDDTIEEATASIDSAKKQAANLKAAKAMGEGGLTTKVSSASKESPKYKGLYKSVGGGAVVPEPVETDTSASGDKQKKNLDAKRMAKEELDLHMDAMFNGEQLSEDFKTKATTIFEAAVNEKVAEIESQLTEEYESRLASVTEQMKSEMTEHLDSYLSYVIEQWMEENRLAVEKGLRTEVAEQFIEGLRNLFLEHNIEVPQGKTNLLDEMANKVDEVTTALNEEMNKNIDLVNKIAAFERKEIIAGLSEGLAETEKEKFASLTESVSFDGLEDFRSKVSVIRENYFNTKEVLTEGVDTYTEESIELNDDDSSETKTQNLSENMSVYSQMLSRMNRNRK
jgi:hypothetical protein